MVQGIKVLWEDADVVVCRKEAGIPTQSAKAGQQDMVSLLRNMRAARGEPPEIYVAHRLDQPVEGLMVFAKNQRAASALSAQFREGHVDKIYHAIAKGRMERQEGRLEDWLLRDGKQNISHVVPPEAAGAKRAALRYRLLASGSMEGEPASLLEVCLESGRHHQIRVQFAHAGHPLVGDKKYDPQCGEGYLPIGLCSVVLSFAHPATGERMEFSIEPEGRAFRLFEAGIA